MALAYRSKDTEFMTTLKRAVARGMADASKREKLTTWNYLKRRIVLDDLHRYAIATYRPGQPLYMGTGSLFPEVMVVTRTLVYLEEESRRLLDAILEAAQFRRVYLTAHQKTKTPIEANWTQFLGWQIRVLKPKAVLVFGSVFPLPLGEIQEKDGYLLLQTYDLSKLMGEGEEIRSVKQETWRHIRMLKAKCMN